MDLIIGGGEYGNVAIERLREEGLPFVLIDENSDCKAAQQHKLPALSADFLPASSLQIPAGQYFVTGGIATAAELILHKAHIRRVFPTAPVHIAAELISYIAGFKQDLHDASLIAEGLPQRLLAGRKAADIYCSLNLANNCIPDCSEPPICPLTKAAREKPLWSMLGEFLCSGKSAASEPLVKILQSRQYGPGLGFVNVSDIKAIIKSVEAYNHLWIATACECHGVVTALKRTDSPLR